MSSAAQLHVPKTQVPQTGYQWGSVGAAVFVQTPRPHVHTGAPTSAAGTPEPHLVQQPADLRTGGALRWPLLGLDGAGDSSEPRPFTLVTGNGVTPKRHSACGACSLPSHAPQTNCYKGSARGTHGQTDGQTWLPGGFWRAALLVFHPSVDALLLMCYLHGYPRWLSSAHLCRHYPGVS